MNSVEFRGHFETNRAKWNVWTPIHAGSKSYDYGQASGHDTFGTCAEPDDPTVTSGVEWWHTLGDIVTELVRAGLRLEYLHEWPHSVSPCLPGMQQAPDGAWYDAERPNRFPQMFSLRAWKD